jgi:protein-S-isoprenylcysteine O-methyltransferase Ste14
VWTSSRLPMVMKASSVLAFAGMVAGIFWLSVRRELLAASVAGLIVQGLAVAMMVGARMTFGVRSFHAAANPTRGGLVTTGFYRLLRHPIYASALYFVWAAALDHHSLQAFAAAVLTTTGAAVRMYAEEQLLGVTYPGYAAYRARTARVIPFVY